ncbi:MAG: 50S ribosomal protein L6 [Desulfobacteraceae bacterium]|nr:50S ribosomal protein L6 [Desulfobacteraceae bacterium]
MSRIGKKPIQLLEKVKAVVKNKQIKIEGPKGSLDLDLNPAIAVEITKEVIKVTSTDDNDREKVAIQGLFRSLIANMVEGVSKGFEKKLKLSGIGYKGELKGKDLVLNLGFSNPVDFKVPEGISAMVDKNTEITLSGIDKGLVGQTAANLRALRPPEPYKGKGIICEGERIIRKVGKTAGGE